MSASAIPLPRRRFFGRLAAAVAGGAWLGGAGRAGRARASVQGTSPPYIGEIRMFAGNFAPNGWMFCEGQLLPISENETLFQVIGTIYGGDGQETFGLPDLRGRAPIHWGQGPGISNNYVVGETGGAEEHILTVTQLPPHTHAAGASSANGSSDDPAGRVPARNAAGVPQYAPTADTNLSPLALLPAGGTQPHTNMQPYLGIHYIISLFGVFPSQ